MSAKVFERRLSDGALNLLRAMPDWWRDVLDHRYVDDGGVERPLLIALRAGYLNVYVEGQSILKVGFGTSRGENSQVRCKLHRKYVLGSDAGESYLDFDGSQVTDPTNLENTIAYSGPKTIDSWVKAARIYSGDEKKGVARIAENHPNVIDVEMALPANEPSEGKPKAANRMDIVALEKADDKANDARLHLAFYEAKLFTNSELRAHDLNPRVLRQLRNYQDYLSDPVRKKQVLDAYVGACKILKEIALMRSMVVGAYVEAICDGAPLDLDPSPRLIVFGHKAANAGEDSSWHRHGQALINQGVPLLMVPAPGDVRLPL